MIEFTEILAPLAGAVVTATKLLVKRNGDWEESTIEAKNNGSWN